jgi:dTMP kinase
MAGRFITFEGIDGCGKTTHARTLVDRLDREGVRAVLLREPGGTAIGERVRAILLDKAHMDMAPEAELLLFTAARAQIVREVVRPALAEGTVVVLDRFTDSSEAYQGFGRGLDLEAVRQVNRFATGGLRPDLTIWLDIDEAEAARRMGVRPEAADRLDDEGASVMKRVREGYRRLAEDYAERFRAVPASGSVEDVDARIDALLKEVWP